MEKHIHQNVYIIKQIQTDIYEAKASSSYIINIKVYCVVFHVVIITYIQIKVVSYHANVVTMLDNVPLELTNNYVESF